MIIAFFVFTSREYKLAVSDRKRNDIKEGKNE